MAVSITDQAATLFPVFSFLMQMAEYYTFGGGGWALLPNRVWSYAFMWSGWFENQHDRFKEVYKV